jgi:hypothetical protein
VGARTFVLLAAGLAIGDGCAGHRTGMTTARVAPRWEASSPRSFDRGTVVLAAAGTWLMLLLAGLALLLV